MEMKLLPLGGTGLLQTEDFDTVAEMPELVIQEGYPVTVVLKSHRGQIPIAGGLWETMGEVQRRNVARSLGMSVTRSQSYLMGAFLANGFTTSTTQDGKAIFADDHPLKVGGTWDNKYALSLSADNVALVESYVRAAPTDQGISGQYRPRYLAVGPDQKKLAYEICFGGGPGAADNDVYWQRLGLIPVVVDEIDTDDWMLLREMEQGFVFGVQQAPVQKLIRNETRDLYIALAQYRGQVGCGTPRVGVGNGV
jgi:hypothetical protein